MPLVPLLTDEQVGPDAKAVFDDIRASRNADYINNIWRALANDPKQLKLTSEQVKAIMGSGPLDPLTSHLPRRIGHDGQRTGCHPASRVRCAGLRPPLTPDDSQNTIESTHSEFKRGIFF